MLPASLSDVRFEAVLTRAKFYRRARRTVSRAALFSQRFRIRLFRFTLEVPLWFYIVQITGQTSCFFFCYLKVEAFFLSDSAVGLVIC